MSQTNSSAFLSCLTLKNPSSKEGISYKRTQIVFHVVQTRSAGISSITQRSLPNFDKIKRV